ncbi:EbsA family protein [Lapidilactobacillus mulanensis]|uniref:EbsA family protein n=1 Tax=Lapidilactobacillus mulanensis TaxID=2485999 RepID=A0ABW4DNM9_9LACO|nr:EbsA family protein [Lapidilactobacillus mulanensis]
MPKKNKLYCQPLTLSRMNLWLWVTCLLLLAIIIQLEMTDKVSWLAITLAVVFVVATIYLGLSSFISVDPVTKAINSHYPFSRQALILARPQVVAIEAHKYSVQIQLEHDMNYRFLMTKKKRQELIRLWEGK